MASIEITTLMSSRVERLAPVALAAVGAGVALVVDLVWEHEPFSRHVATGAMALGLIVAGFTATQRNMLLSMSGSRVLRFAASTGYYKDILNYLTGCVYAGLSVTVLSLIGIFLEDCGVWQSVWMATWVGSIVLIICVLVRNELLMNRIFTRFMEGQTK